MVDGLYWFLLAMLAVALLGSMLWGSLQIMFVDGLDWLMRKLGFSGPGKDADLNKNHSIASVLEPFAVDSYSIQAKSKVLYRGEVWDAFCKPEIASTLEKGDQVEVVRNSDLSFTVSRRI